VAAVLTVALLNNPGLQGTPAARRPSPHRSPTTATVASPDGQYPGTCSGDSVDRQNNGAPVLCAVACLLAVLTYGEALSDHIVSYRIAIFCVISYRIVYRVPYGCIVPSLNINVLNVFKCCLNLSLPRCWQIVCKLECYMRSAIEPKN